MTNYEVSEDGFALVPHLLVDAEQEDMRAVLGAAEGAGTRGLLANPEVARLAQSAQILELVGRYLPGAPRPVRAIYFDKTTTINWIVAWHQDLTIAVQEKSELPGFGPWSMKNGVNHVQPPAELLEQMITLRIHLDDADSTNGALRVLPGTHRHGRLSVEQIHGLREQCQEVLCGVSSGDALLMRPLLLHASSRSTTKRRRRVLHIEYAGFDLPPPLRWREDA